MRTLPKRLIAAVLVAAAIVTGLLTAFASSRDTSTDTASRDQLLQAYKEKTGRSEAAELLGLGYESRPDEVLGVYRGREVVIRYVCDGDICPPYWPHLVYDSVGNRFTCWLVGGKPVYGSLSKAFSTCDVE